MIRITAMQILNQDGRDSFFRNPVYLLAGVEIDGPVGKRIQGGSPVAVLYGNSTGLRISHPDLIWDDDLHITETQKSIARVHRIPDELLCSLWEEAGPERGAPANADKPPLEVGRSNKGREQVAHDR